MTYEADMDLTDAYTGLPVRVVLEPTPGGLMCSVPGARSPREFFGSLDDARRALNPELVCPYTGERLRPVDVDGMVMFAGGFDPRLPRPREEFLRMSRSRAGAPAPEAPPERVEWVDPDPPPAPLSREAPVTQEACDAVEEMIRPKRSKSKRSKSKRRKR